MFKRAPRTDQSAMFQTKLIARFHHLYMIQALLEIQRHCNKLYKRLKHTIVYLVCKRLHLNRFLNLGEKNEEDCCYDRDYYVNQVPNIYSDGLTRSIFNDLDEILISKDGITNKRGIGVESVPMLLLPFIVQPHGFVRNNVRGGLDNSLSSSPTSYHMCNVSNDNSKRNNNIENSQQWQNRSNKQGNVCSMNQFLTIVPSQLGCFSAQSQAARIPVSKHQSNIMTFEQHIQQQHQQQRNATNQLKFCTQKTHSDQRLLNDGGQTNSFGSLCSSHSRFSSGSSPSPLLSNNHYDTSNRRLTIRNPLLNYVTSTSDYARKKD